MTAASKRLALAVGLVLAGGASGQPGPAQKVPVTTDLHGDPLPAGATARLGTTRFRHQESLLAIAFSADGKALYATDTTGAVRVWDAATGRERRKFHTDSGPCVLAAFLADGKVLYRHGYNQPSSLWDVDTGKQIYFGKGTPGAATRRSARLVGDLNSDSFAVRQKAAVALEEMGEDAGAALRAALAGNPSLESRRRLEGLLRKVEDTPASPERLRPLRAVTVLEWAGTPAARQALEVLARGAPEARPTRDVRNALNRLALFLGERGP